MSNFAPYQDHAPDVERAKSPPPRRSLSRSPQPPFSFAQNWQRQQPNIAEALPPPDSFDRTSSFGPGAAGRGSGAEDVESGYQQGALGSSGRMGREHIDLFETSLPLRMDHEAMLAYLLLPPAGGVLLLVMEHKSDYVRFHAWQSSLLFATIFVAHLLFSFSSVISWMLFVMDIGLIALLTMRAYRDADTLDRFEIPFFGRMASSFVDDE